MTDADDSMVHWMLLLLSAETAVSEEDIYIQTSGEETACEGRGRGRKVSKDKLKRGKRKLE